MEHHGTPGFPENMNMDPKWWWDDHSQEMDRMVAQVEVRKKNRPSWGVGAGVVSESMRK